MYKKNKQAGNKQIFLFLSILTCAASWPVMAKDAVPVPEAVTELGTRIFPHGLDSAGAAPIKGLFAITSGTKIIYVSGDGKYAMEGELFDMRNGENLTEKQKDLVRAKMLGALDERDMIRFSPDDTRHTITVFTDVDCGYCRKLHSEIPMLHDAGIAVRYLGFPRAGPGSETYEKMVSIWCAKDRRKAMTDAKAGKKIPGRQCKNPLQEHVDAGRRFGVRGTPAIVLEDGSLISGYLPAARLRELLEKMPENTTPGG